MKQSRQTLAQLFQAQVDNLSLTLQPFTIVKYQYVARYFVGYLRDEFPQICRLSQLRRDPHMLGFFRWLCELRPPIGNPTRRQRLLCLRRLLNDLAAQGHQLQPGLIIPEDLPTLPEYLPRPLSPQKQHTRCWLNSRPTKRDHDARRCHRTDHLRARTNHSAFSGLRRIRTDVPIAIAAIIRLPMIKRTLKPTAGFMLHFISRGNQYKHLRV
jgi:hypothetical protein